MGSIRHYMDIVENAGLSETAYPFRKIAARLTRRKTGKTCSIEELRERVKNLLQGWRGEVFQNESTGYDITLTRASVNKSISTGEVLLRIHHVLPALLRKGVFLSSDPPKSTRPNMIEMLNLGASVVLDGQLIHVVIKIRRYPQGNHHYSLHYDGDMDTLQRDSMTGTPPDFNPAGGGSEPI